MEGRTYADAVTLAMVGRQIILLLSVLGGVCCASYGYWRGRAVERALNEVTLRSAEGERDEAVSRARRAEVALRECRLRKGGY